MSLRLPSVNHLFAGIRLRAARARYDSCPGPATAAKVARLLLNLRRGDEALRTIKEARQLFPHAVEVREAYYAVRRYQAKVALRLARRRLKIRSTPENFVKVANLYRTLGQYNHALKALDAAEKRFPDHWAVYLAKGQLFFNRYKETKKTSDSGACLESLREARRLNQSSYQTLVYFAITTSQLGLYLDARDAIQSILDRNPNDRRALEVKKWIERAEASQTRAAKAVAATPKAAVIDDERPVTRPSSHKQGTLDPELAPLAALEGVSGLFVFGADGNLAYASSERTTEFDFTDAVDVVKAIVAECRFDASNLGLGELDSCSLSGDTWRIVVRAEDSHYLAVFRDRTQCSRPLVEDVEEALAKSHV